MLWQGAIGGPVTLGEHCLQHFLHLDDVSCVGRFLR